MVVACADSMIARVERRKILKDSCSRGWNQMFFNVIWEGAFYCRGRGAVVAYMDSSRTIPLHLGLILVFMKLKFTIDGFHCR